jgi:hypothetical protein
MGILKESYPKTNTDLTLKKSEKSRKVYIWIILLIKSYSLRIIQIENSEKIVLQSTEFSISLNHQDLCFTFNV